MKVINATLKDGKTNTYYFEDEAEAVELYQGAKEKLGKHELVHFDHVYGAASLDLAYVVGLDCFDKAAILEQTKDQMRTQGMAQLEVQNELASKPQFRRTAMPAGSIIPQ